MSFHIGTAVMTPSLYLQFMALNVPEFDGPVTLQVYETARDRIDVYLGNLTVHRVQIWIKSAMSTFNSFMLSAGDIIVLQMSSGQTNEEVIRQVMAVNLYYRSEELVHIEYDGKEFDVNSLSMLVDGIQYHIYLHEGQFE